MPPYYPLVRAQTDNLGEGNPYFLRAYKFSLEFDQLKIVSKGVPERGGQRIVK